MLFSRLARFRRGAAGAVRVVVLCVAGEGDGGTATTEDLLRFVGFFLEMMAKSKSAGVDVRSESDGWTGLCGVEVMPESGDSLVGRTTTGWTGWILRGLPRFRLTAIVVEGDDSVLLVEPLIVVWAVAVSVPSIWVLTIKSCSKVEVYWRTGSLFEFSLSE